MLLGEFLIGQKQGKFDVHGAGESSDKVLNKTDFAVYYKLNLL